MSFEKLLIWQRSMKLVEAIYALTAGFPSKEKFGMTSQIQRAAVSVPSNIAEGSQRNTNKEFAHFLLIAKGSLAEVLTQSILASRLGYISAETIVSLRREIEEISRMIHVFHAKVAHNS